MRKTILALFCALFCALSACGGENGAEQELRRVEDALDLDLSGGTLERFEDSHGGFHGDGLTAAEVTVEGLVEELANAGGWRPLPMSNSAAQAIRLCEAQVYSRFSYNFTMAVYDSGNGRLYFYELDT